MFVDTSAWVALRYQRDRHHARAAWRGGCATRAMRWSPPNWMVGETVTSLKARGAVDHALALGTALLAGRPGRLVETTPERRERGWALFLRNRALRVGLVDCMSFAVMDELGLRCFFGFDDDFVRAGYEALR